MATNSASAQTGESNFVIRDPVSNGMGQSSQSSAVSYQRHYATPPATRKFRPERWASRVFPVQELQSPQEKLDQDVDSIPLDDKFQTELQGEIDEATQLEEEAPRQRRQTEMDFGEWPKKAIRDIRVSVSDDHQVVPRDYSFLLTDRTGPNWTSISAGDKVFAWVAPNIRYQPLYYQNVPLERYGQTYGGAKQIAASGIHFFASTALLPIALVIDRPHSCDYPLGYCRPGNPTQFTFQRLLNRSGR